MDDRDDSSTEFEDLEHVAPLACITFQQALDMISPPLPPLIQALKPNILAAMEKRKLIRRNSYGHPRLAGLSLKEVDSFVGNWKYAEVLSRLWDGVLASTAELDIELPLASTLAFKVFKVIPSKDHQRRNSSKPDACFILNPQQTSEFGARPAASQSFKSAPTSDGDGDNDNNESAFDNPALSNPNSRDRDYWCNIVMPMVFESRQRPAHTGNDPVSRSPPYFSLHHRKPLPARNSYHTVPPSSARFSKHHSK